AGIDQSTGHPADRRNQAVRRIVRRWEKPRPERDHAAGARGEVVVLERLDAGLIRRVRRAADAAIEEANGFAVDVVDAPVIEVRRCARRSEGGVDQLYTTGGAGVAVVVFHEEPVVPVHRGRGDHDAQRAIVDNPVGGGAEDLLQDLLQVLGLVYESFGDPLGVGNDAGGREDLVRAVGVDLEHVLRGNAGRASGGEQRAGGSAGAEVDVIARETAELFLELHQAAAGKDTADASAADRENVAHQAQDSILGPTDFPRVFPRERGSGGGGLRGDRRSSGALRPTRPAWDAPPRSPRWPRARRVRRGRSARGRGVVRDR